jgi:hypothetical protein
MYSALNREASEARMIDLRRRAERDALARAAMRAVNQKSGSIPASIAAMLRLLQPRRIRRTLPRAIAADIDSACRLPASWDHRQGFSATSMGPPGCQ